ncbi:MAG: ATP-binding protein [Anaerolineales bacterium]
MKFISDLLASHLDEGDWRSTRDAMRMQLLDALVGIALLMSPVAVLGNLLSAAPRWHINVIGAAAFLMALGLRWLLRRGQMIAASWVWLVFVSAAVTGSMIQQGTITIPMTAFFAFNIVTTGFLLNRRALLVVTLYSILAVIGVGWAQEQGFLPSVGQFLPVSVYWFYYALLFVTMALVVMYWVVVLEQTIARLIRETEERRNTEAMLRQRDAILEAVAYTAQQFLESLDWRDNIHKVLEHLGMAVGATHAYIFERHITPAGYFALSQRYEWVRPGYPADIDNPEYQNISLACLETKSWYLELSCGRVMQANLRTCSPDLAEYFAQRGIQSILEIPIVVAGQWWGVLGFDDFVQARNWSAQEVETIDIAASTLGLTIQRQRGEQALRQRESIMEAAAFAAKSFLESSDWRAVIQDVLTRLGEATGSSHVYLFENHLLPDGQEVTSQRYEWVAPGCQPDIDNPIFQNMRIEEDHTETWLKYMRAGEVYYCNLNQIPESDHALYLERKLLTYLDAPIYVNGVWWGILGMDDNYRVRDWAAVELDAIKVAASTLSSAIQRQLRDESFREAERQHRQELEQRVQERTRQLQDALQEIEGVSFTASHDLRAPLRAVDGYASILLNDHSDSLTEEQVGYIRKIKQSSQRMARLLDDLIRLIRYSRQPIQKQVVDLSSLAHRALQTLQAQDPHRVVMVTIAPNLTACGDRTLLDVVIHELFNNAWKFTKDCPAAEIQFGSIEQNGQTVFFLKDNGIGFDMAYEHKLFRNFEQLHQPGMVEGTGMGLSMVHRIIQRHGGRIWAEGRLNEGATFYFTLPPS